ncbi:ArsR/SmtB family transcription factor [Cohnella terricola]|uniref:Helix-turn-helix transcriptional regulator n=1 Tax=Cohnella terricola TaxID=1289167 RepID=A0A559JDG8_9BACL|nr:metalloregulator ArsR/SmtB family transcription factor [Cohnella terricola]TVX97921.1 helix-turn-helix transcriptional regulator [Cohnella terricola]
MDKITLERPLDCCAHSEIQLAEVKERMITDGSASRLAELFKALGDPTRIKLIGALLHRELCVHELSQLLEMGQSAVSHQLRYLRNMRMVKRRKSGKTVFYSLDDSHIEQIFLQTLQHLEHG